MARRFANSRLGKESRKSGMRLCDKTRVGSERSEARNSEYEVVRTGITQISSKNECNTTEVEMGRCGTDLSTREKHTLKTTEIRCYSLTLKHCAGIKRRTLNPE